MASVIKHVDSDTALNNKQSQQCMREAADDRFHPPANRRSF